MERHVARRRALGFEGSDEEADKINLKPILSGIKTEDEGLYVAQHTYWLEEMKKALAAEQAKA